MALAVECETYRSNLLLHLLTPRVIHEHTENGGFKYYPFPPRQTEGESSGRHPRSVVVVVRVFLHQQPLRFQSVRGDGTRLDLLLPVPPTQETQDALKRVPHVCVATRVDDGVNQRVAFSQNQAVLLVFQHMAVLAL